MFSPKRFVVESNIPSAAPVRQDQFGNGMSRKQIREQEDITAWMQMQEDAELDLIAQELNAKNSRNGRRYLDY